MLKINLLTERRDAEREYRKMQQGNPNVDHLVMHLDTTVRRRVNQNTRNRKKMVVKRAAKIRLQQTRRAAKTFAPWLGTLGGPTTLNAGKKKPVGKDTDIRNKFSRCLFCNTHFEKDSAFAFCGETLLESGDCKQAWLAVHPETSELGVLTPVPEPPVGLKKPSKATVARMLAERKDYLPSPRRA
jgi:hypothetical protein